MRKGRIFVISAPSGSGKTTIQKKVLRKIKDLTPSVSLTTRKPRKGERDKKDYQYLPREAFKKEIKKGKLLEWEENFGYLYGTPKEFVLEKIREGKDVLLSIDVRGAENIKKKFPESVLIFIKPPSMSELSRRLKERNTDRAAEVIRRLKLAKTELGYAAGYDYVVVNRELESAVNKVTSIIKKERSG
jgi:guanylate kinase